MQVDPAHTQTDRLALVRTMAALHDSPTARPLLERALDGGVSIRIQDDIEIGAGQYGSYHSRDKTIWLRRSTLEHDPDEAVETLAHELQHAVDHTSGGRARLRDRLDAQYLTEGWRDDRIRSEQVGYHTGIVGEARAYVLESQVRDELGIAPELPHEHAMADAPTELAAYQIAFAREATRDNLHMLVPFGDPPVVFMPGSTPEDPV